VDTVTFRYKNHRGEEAVRRVRPIRVWFGSTAFHPGPGWLLEAWDLDRQATRDFAMSNMLSGWERILPQCPAKELDEATGQQAVA
jgi:predicted DNA-binding transcriptional regulator YafY